MIATILAAGMSRRLRPLTDTQPKCLLKVGQRSLLGRAFDAHYGAGIEDFVIVTGYRDESIQSFLHNNYPTRNISFVKNADYESTNSLYSLWMARKLVAGQQMILLDSDILLEPDLVRRLEEEEESVLAYRKDKLDEDDMKVVTDTGGLVTEISRTCEVNEAVGEAVGVEKINADYSKALFKELDLMVNDEHLTNSCYELAFERLIHKGMKFRAIDTSDIFSAHLDTIDDLKKAKDDISEEMF